MNFRDEIDRSKERSIAYADLQHMQSAADVESMYYRLRSQLLRIDNNINCIKIDLSYHSLNNYQTSSIHVTFGSTKNVMLSAYLVSQEWRENHLSLTASLSKDSAEMLYDTEWERIVYITNQMGSCYLDTIFINIYKCDAHFLHIKDCVLELRDALLERAAMQEMLLNIASIYATFLDEISETDLSLEEIDYSYKERDFSCIA